MFCIAGYWLLTRMRKMKILFGRLKAWRRGYFAIEDDFAETLPDRLKNPEHYSHKNLKDSLSSNDTTQNRDETITY